MWHAADIKNFVIGTVVIILALLFALAAQSFVGELPREPSEQNVFIDPND